MRNWQGSWVRPSPGVQAEALDTHLQVLGGARLEARCDLAWRFPRRGCVYLPRAPQVLLCGWERGPAWVPQVWLVPWGEEGVKFHPHNWKLITEDTDLVNGKDSLCAQL